MSKIRFLNCSAEKVFTDLLDSDNGYSKQKPIMSKPLLKWIESNESSSEYLRSNPNVAEVNIS